MVHGTLATIREKGGGDWRLQVQKCQDLINFYTCDELWTFDMTKDCKEISCDESPDMMLQN